MQLLRVESHSLGIHGAPLPYWGLSRAQYETSQQREPAPDDYAGDVLLGSRPNDLVPWSAHPRNIKHEESHSESPCILVAVRPVHHLFAFVEVLRRTRMPCRTSARILWIFSFALLEINVGGLLSTPGCSNTGATARLRRGCTRVSSRRPVDMVLASEDVNRMQPLSSTADNGDVLATIPPGVTRVRRRTRAKQKLNSAVEGVSKPHVFDKEIFALALPTLGAVLIDPCLSLVDTGYVGRLGALSLAAIGPCAAAFNFVFVTASCALLVSTSVLVSEQRAMGDRAAIGRTLTLASGLSVSMGVIMATLFYINSAGLLSLMGAPQEVMGLAVPYLRWRASAFPANLFLLVACGAFRGMGEPQSGLNNALVVGAVNLVLDPVLMFTCGLGVTGAAMATAAAQWVGAVVYAKYMWTRRETLGLANGASIPGWGEVKQFLGAGGAMVFRQLCNVGAWTVMASAATRMGILEVAAHQLMLSLWLVIAFVQESLGSSGQVLVAQYLGLARDSRKAAGLTKKAPWVGDALKSRDTARSIAKRVLTLSLGLGIGLAGCSRACFPALLGVVCQSKEVAALVSRVFPPILYAFPMCCVVWTWDSLFYGASDFIYNAKTVAVASACGVIGSVLSLRRGWGILGLWVSMTYVLFGVRMAAHMWRFNSRRGPFGPSVFLAESRLNAEAVADVQKENTPPEAATARG